MIFKRLVIISCCALGGLAFGRWLSPPPLPRAAEQRQADSQVAPPAPLELPPPTRAGRVPFLEVYRSLRSSSAEEQVSYLHSLQKLPDGPDRRAALTAFFQCMASISPQKAADLVRQVGKDDIQRAALAVLGATPASSTAILVKMLVDLPADIDPKWREQRLNGQMYYWAAFDPTAAAQFADQYQSIYPDLATTGLLQCLAVADPVAAERWLNEHPDLRKRPEAMADYIHGLFQTDPANARRYITEHATDEALELSLRGVARFTFLSSPNDAVEFVSHLPTKESRQVALASILGTNTELFVNSETSRTALCAGLAEWVTKFSADNWPTNMPQFLAEWHALDPAGPVSWMAKLPSSTRSLVAGNFLRAMGADETKQFVVSTAGDFHRDVLTALARELSQVPADQRKGVIESLDLPPEDAAQLAR
jgi:hypothetical protein